MKTFRQMAFAAVLTLTLALPALAGETQTPPGDISTPGVAGEVSTPGVAGEINTPGASGDVSTPGFVTFLFALLGY